MAENGLLEPVEVYSPKYLDLIEVTKRHEKAHWFEDEVKMSVDVEQWKNGKIKDEEKRLIENILRIFTQCYSDDTEVLTPSGWELISNISESDLVAQWDVVSNECTFVNPISTFSKQYSGPMYNFKDALGRCDLMVTPNHKMLFIQDGESRISEAQDMKWYQGRKLLTSVVKNSGADSLTAEQKVWIAFQADGNVKKDVNGSKLGFIPHRFAFKKQRKIERMRRLLNEAAYGFSEKTEKGYTIFYVESPTRMSKNFDWVDLNSVSTAWCVQFMEELSHWDSHVDKWGKVIYSNTNVEAADIVHAIAVLTGRYVTSSVCVDDRDENINDVRVVRYQDAADPLIDGQAIHRSSTIEQYDGTIVCLTVPSGFLVVRRNFCVSVCGNSDSDVSSAYYDKLIPVIRNPEARQMLGSFAAREATHVRGYALLSDTLGLGDNFYWEFLEYNEMREKHEFFISQIGGSFTEFAEYLAKQTMIEGVSLFASFALLFNFDRLGKLPGMCDVVRWSILDETIHVEGISKLFRIFTSEHPRIVNDDFKKEIYETARKLVKLEDKFIDKTFEMGGAERVTPEEVKQYIRYIADYRLTQLGLKPNWKIKENPLPWMDFMVTGRSFQNFFERSVTEYEKDTLTGSFEAAYNTWR